MMRDKQITFTSGLYDITVTIEDSKLTFQASSGPAMRRFESELTDDTLPVPLRSSYGDCNTIFEILREVPEQEAVLQDNGELKFGFSLKLGKVELKREIVIFMVEVTPASETAMLKCEVERLRKKLQEAEACQTESSRQTNSQLIELSRELKELKQELKDSRESARQTEQYRQEAMELRRQLLEWQRRTEKLEAMLSVKHAFIHEQQLIEPTQQKQPPGQRALPQTSEPAQTAGLPEKQTSPKQHPIRIFVKMFNGSTVALESDLEDTVLDIKKKINEKTGIDVQQLTPMIFAGKLLEDQRTLRAYSIANHSTIHLLLRLRD